MGLVETSVGNSTLLTSWTNALRTSHPPVRQAMVVCTLGSNWEVLDRQPAIFAVLACAATMAERVGA